MYRVSRGQQWLVLSHYEMAPDARGHLWLHILKNIAKGTMDPGVDYFNQLLWFGEISLVGSVW